MKSIYCAIILCLSLLVGASCSKDNESKDDVEIQFSKFVEFSPIELYVFAEDSKGNDLLDISNPDNIISGTTISYGNHIYSFGDKTPPKTKTISPNFVGMEIRKTLNNTNYLYFGQFDGSVERDDVFTIVWGNKTQDVVKYQRKLVFDEKTGKYELLKFCLTLNGNNVTTMPDGHSIILLYLKK